MPCRAVPVGLTAHRGRAGSRSQRAGSDVDAVAPSQTHPSRGDASPPPPWDAPPPPWGRAAAPRRFRHEDTAWTPGALSAEEKERKETRKLGFRSEAMFIYLCFDPTALIYLVIIQRWGINWPHHASPIIVSCLGQHYRLELQLRHNTTTEPCQARARCASGHAVLGPCFLVSC